MRVVGVDIGGTFTDIIITDTAAGQTFTHKVPTTPEDPSRGMIRGIREVCSTASIPPNSIAHVFHGTTIATNAILEYDGARTGMITTEGYRDIIHIGRHQRPQTPRGPGQGDHPGDVSGGLCVDLCDHLSVVS